MKYRINQVKLNIGESKDLLPKKIEKLCRCEVRDWTIRRESLDARDKAAIHYVYTVDFEADRKLNLPEAPDLSYTLPLPGSEALEHRPVVAGFGPCGMFAALILAQAGYKPAVLERGKSIDERTADVEAFWKGGPLNPSSNVQFGEGGAGAFSDGKLTTGIKDGRVRKVLETFAEAGGGEDLLYKQKPHVGTDVLKTVVKNIREEIKSLGGEIFFETQLAGIETEEGRLSAVLTNRGRIPAEILILAPGHSARDTFRYLKDFGLEMSPKPFSIGVRIEHPQELINEAQYGRQDLGAADYKLSYRCESGRGVYTFCMCPGGEVINASSAEGMVVTNGMSLRARDGKFANSGLLVDVRVSDFPSDDCLAGVDFQEKYERLAFVNGGSDYSLPKCSLADFRTGENAVTRSLPGFAVESIREALPEFGKKLAGFDSDDAVLRAVESRSSSPVRIARGEDLQTKIRGLYPAGEGAGYAGGIVSAAVDGIRVAEHIISTYARPEDTKEQNR